MAASGRTPTFDLPYPVGSDSYAFLTDFQSLATAVDTKLGLMLPKTGGTLTGGLTGTTLTLSSALNVSGALTGAAATFSGTVTVAAPTTSGHATTKSYVDSAISSYVAGQGLLTSAVAATTYLPLAGGTVTGAITLPGNPTNNLHAATKQYVDSNTNSSSLTVVYWPGSAGVGSWPARPSVAVGAQVIWRSVLDDLAPPPPNAVAGDSWQRAPGAAY